MLEALYRAIRNDAKPEEITIEGRPYTTGEVHPVHAPLPKTIYVTTLTGIVDYINADVDSLNKDKLLCHVESPASVILYSGLEGGFRDRPAFIHAKLQQVQIPLNKFIGAEEFNILVQSAFVEPDDAAQATDRAKVLRYASNVTQTASANSADDGVTQAVTVRKGVAAVGTEALPNPVTLRPFRTFAEVEQPASRFVFRAKGGEGGEVGFALFEADGGAWRCEAMRIVKEYLEKMVPGLHVIA